MYFSYSEVNLLVEEEGPVKGMFLALLSISCGFLSLYYIN